MVLKQVANGGLFVSNSPVDRPKTSEQKASDTDK